MAYESLLKVIFNDKSGNPASLEKIETFIEKLQQQITEALGSDLHQIGVATMGTENIDEKDGIFISAKSPESCLLALGILLAAAEEHDLSHNRHICGTFKPGEHEPAVSSF